jgi:hypothetical protein
MVAMIPSEYLSSINPTLCDRLYIINLTSKYSETLLIKPLVKRQTCQETIKRLQSIPTYFIYFAISGNMYGKISANILAIIDIVVKSL